MNGQSVEAHLGRPVSEMVKPEVYAQFEPYLKRALNGESFPGIEVQKPSSAPGAPAATMMATHQPVRDEAGEILGVCVSITDISVVKQKEEALRQSEDHYRHTVEINPPIPDSLTHGSRREQHLLQFLLGDAHRPYPGRDKEL